MSNLSRDELSLEIATLLERRRIAQAETRLGEALERFPDDIELLIMSAQIDYLNEDVVAASATIARILELDPDNPGARTLEFELLFDDNQLVEAEQAILSLLSDYPESPYYYSRYADLMIRTMHIEKAGALAAEGLRLDPYDEECLTMQTLCDFINNPSGRSSEALQQLLMDNPESHRTLLLLIVAMEDKGDYRAAYRIVQELVQSQPDNEAYVTFAAGLRAASHWTMLPLWPMARWGWGGSIGIWIGMLIILWLLPEIAPESFNIVFFCFAAYVIYSWVWPTILKGLLAAR